jgi:hypothetical protein
MSKQFRIVPVDSKTRATHISRHFEKILCAVRNRLLPILYKILDNGRIPTGRQVDDVLEEVRAMYYKEMKMEGAKADSADSGEDGEDVALSSQMEDFPSYEYYILCEWGPTVIGGRGHVNFLKNAEDMQESLGNGGSRTSTPLPVLMHPAFPAAAANPPRCKNWLSKNWSTTSSNHRKTPRQTSGKL